MDQLKLVSGGQTGVDRAMLDFCLARGIPCGGWCPEGRSAEDGSIDPAYPVRELLGAGYEERTAANVKDSDATVIIFHRQMEGGTLKSFEYAKQEQKPVLLLDMSLMDIEKAARKLLDFVHAHKPRILNFSGPRHSEWPEGYNCCYALLQHMFGKGQTERP
jgi:hypothetical protein